MAGFKEGAKMTENIYQILKKEIYILHRYYIWQDRMRVHFEDVLKNSQTREGTSLNKDDINKFLYMSYWYGGLYVVVEGWKELKLCDKKINRLLKNTKFVNFLKRYRNATFHFQKRKYFDEKFMSFVEEKGSVNWVRDLNQEFSRFFLDYFKELRKNQK